MKGAITIRASEFGFGLDIDIEDVSPQDKFECMHSLSTALQMDEHDMFMYTLMEQLGVFKDAEAVTHCETDEEVQRLLQGGVQSEG